MVENSYEKITKRKTEIEDRKIEILLEIANIKDNYNRKISSLISEYSQLDNEHYQLKLISIRNIGIT